jgi:hypothetical protein
MSLLFERRGLARLWGTRQISLREISRQLGVDPLTVKDTRPERVYDFPEKV